MLKKEVVKSFAISGIFLMVISLFAFSFILGSYIPIVSATHTQTGALPLEDKGYIAPIPEPKPLVTPATTIPTSIFTPSTTIQTTKTVVETFSDGEYLVTEGTIEIGENVKAINLATGEAGDLTIGEFAFFNTRDATVLESQFSGVITVGTESLSASSLLSKTSLSPAELGALKDAGFTDVVVGKSFLKDGVKYTIEGNALTSSKITTFEILGQTFTGLTAHLIQGALWAAGVVAAIQLFGPMFGLEDETTNALSTAAAVGIITGKGLIGAAEEFGGIFEIFGVEKFGLSYGAWTGIGVAVVVFLLLYEKQDEKIVTFSCLPWQAPTGGENCEQCNKQGILPCSEYQCKSLGQSCELINKGTNEEACVWVNRQDVNPPTIEPWEDALLNDYRYIPDNAINPPDRGVKILYDKSLDNCIPAFTPLRFGVELNEPAKCKVDVLRKENFETMSSFMSGGLSRYNHSYALSLPGERALNLENITLLNDGNYELFVRCQDSNGNSNVATFVFKYCVDPGADTTPPLIVTTSILNNVPVAFNQSSIDLEVYVNEPSDCKWSRNDRDFSSMEETMSCSNSIFEFNAQVLYKCSTTLTGINDRVENKFYFRCKDQPNAPESDRNVNAESFEFTLIGTQPLVIDFVNPNETTVSDSTDVVKVTIEVRTSSGFKEGEAICYYSDTGNENDFIKFFETGSFEHSQDLFLTGGSYEYFIRCTDLGGNSDSATINFDVETDLSSPLVVRAYKEENFLKLITDENAECVYSTFDCNYEFDEGTQVTVVNGTNHFTSWSTELSLYIKCKDDFGNRPLPNQCSITLRPSDF